MTRAIPPPLRPFLLVAPGTAILFIVYWLDFPNPDMGVYPAHVWSTVAAVAGWWLVLAALALIGRTQMIGWLALLSALAVASAEGDNATLLTSPALPYLGVLGACLVLVLASSGAVLNNFSRRERITWSLVFAAIGIAVIALNSIFPRNPIWDGPVGFWC